MEMKGIHWTPAITVGRAQWRAVVWPARPSSCCARGVSGRAKEREGLASFYLHIRSGDERARGTSGSNNN